ncbi:MAG: dihydrofolate reductase family protein [Gemmatimonadaceae bacterium]
MMRTSVFIAASLDGYIARPDGANDWLMQAATSGEDHGYDDFISTIDVMVLGRASFEKALTFDGWPYGALRVVVLSRTLSDADIPEALRAKVSIHPGPVDAPFVQWLGESGATHAYIDGGKVIQSFIRAGLLDDMIVTRIPVLLGSGLPLFGDVSPDVWWDHLSTRAFPSGLVQSEYRKRGNGANA